MQKTAVALAAALLLGSPGWGHAGQVEGTGSLRAVGRDGRPLGACPLVHTDVRAEVSGFVARVVVTQRFENRFDRPVEAIYTFPLSERAAVDAMLIKVGSREVRGDVKRREEARKIYEQARERGQVAGLLDQERPNVFTQSIANLMPAEPVEVRIEYVEALRYEDGTFEFAFPTVVGPRFVPPATGSGPRVPDAGRIAPPVTPVGTRAGHDVSIAVDIRAGLPILGVESRLHEVDVEQPAPDRALVRLARKAEIPNRDFVLRYAVAGADLRSGYLAHRAAGRDGYVTFALVPPRRVAPDEAAPKEMVFVIDRSGSQHGLPLTKAKETMLWILDRLNPDDTFQIVDFSSRANVLFDRPSRATPEARRRARAHIASLEANGGTMMAEAVRRVASLPADDHRVRVVTFMTDGYVGNDFEVVDLVRRLRGTSRWFPFGTGNSVNRFLLEAMARYGGGEVEYVLLGEPGEVVARKFYERVSTPVLTDVTLEFEGLDVVDVSPAQPSDVWAQRPLVVHARYRRPGAGRVVLHGYRAGKPYREAIDVRLPDREDAHGAIASMWARARVDDLVARDLRGLQSGDPAPEVREAVVTVALEHRLLTPFTSFVAVEERIVNRGGVATRVQVPVEMPQGVTYEGVFGGAGQVAGGPAPAGAFMRYAVSQGAAAERLADRAAGGRPSLDAPERRRGSGEPTASRPTPLSGAARQRLGPDLLALLEGRTPGATRLEVIDGRVEVKVVLAGRPQASLARLRAAGLRVRLIAEGFVVGAVAVTDLPALAEVEGVVSIVPAV